MYSSRYRAFALFDFDGTMIKGNSIVAFLRYACSKKAFPRREYFFILSTYVRHLLGVFTADVTKTRVFRFMHFLSAKRRKELERSFALEVLLPRIYPEALAEIKRHKEEGRIVVLLSASTENYMQYLAEPLGIDVLLCTPYNSCGLVGPNCKGTEKMRRLRRWIEEAHLLPDHYDSYAYSDSFSDLPMLDFAAHPILVNPSRKLAKIATKAKQVKWGKK